MVKYKQQITIEKSW